MDKRVVGLIVSVGVVILLIIMVTVGNLTLRKSDGNNVEQSQTRTAVSQTNQNSAQQQTNVSNNPVKESPQEKTASDSSSNLNSNNSNKEPSETLVKKVVEQSQKVSEGFTVTDDSLVLNPSQGVLGEDLYEVKGVVRKLELLESNNEIQAQYRADIEIKLGNTSINLDYFTTVNSIKSLQPDTEVLVKYQLTDTEKLVIKGLSLVN